MGCCDQPGLMPLATGLEKLLALVNGQTETEIVPLAQAAGRVLAEDVYADAPVPGFDNSAMDGYAVRAEDLSLQESLIIQGKSFAGNPYRETLRPGHAVRIMTGAAMPAGADTVIMQENTETDGVRVRFTELAAKGNNVRVQGDDIRQGDVVMKSRTEINAARIALLASIGCAEVKVYRRTRVGLLSTGDELRTPGEPLGYGDIYNSNGPAVQFMLSQLGVDIVDYGIIKDDPDLFRQAFTRADLECDFVLTSGGVSVGEADYTKDILEELGQIDFWKLAIKPGKPFAFGKLPNSYFIGLPGNPVSAMVTFHILAAQALRQHQNIGYQPMHQVTAITRSAIRKSPGRMDFQRGRWTLRQGVIEVDITRANQGSHILTSLGDANCYIALEADRGDVSAGETVTLWLFDNVLGSQ